MDGPVSFIADDIFFEADEGGRSHDGLFAALRTNISVRKSAAVVSCGYAWCSRRRTAGHESHRSDCSKRRTASTPGSCQVSTSVCCLSGQTRRFEFESEARVLDLRRRIADEGMCPFHRQKLVVGTELLTDMVLLSELTSDVTLVASTSNSWLGCTLPMADGAADIQMGQPSWAKGNGLGFQLRCGPNYGRSPQKCPSDGSLYECVTVDMVTSDQKVDGVLERLVSVPHSTSSWSRGCPLPRFICVNTQLPYGPGSTMRSSGSGSNVISIFQIKDETLRALCEPEKQSAGFRNFLRFCQEPMGTPDAVDDPARSLNSRRNPKKRAMNDSGLFKAVAVAENWDAVGLPDSLRAFNGKPVLISKSGTIVKDPEGEWVEITVDLGQFALLARSSLWLFRELLPRAQLHIGFLIQGMEDDELPEGLIGDVRLHHVDMMAHPQHIQI